VSIIVIIIITFKNQMGAKEAYLLVKNPFPAKEPNHQADLHPQGRAKQADWWRRRQPYGSSIDRA